MELAFISDRSEMLEKLTSKLHVSEVEEDFWDILFP